MNILAGLAVAGLVIAGAALLGGSGSSSGGGGYNSNVNLNCGWDDDVGSELQSQAENACNRLNSAVNAYNNAFDKVKNLNPIEYKSQAENLSRIVDRINSVSGV